ncbi:MAG: peptidoglycan-binding protein [Lachnospiraceae bacterium]|nr:peptidoglycan-binding protein [Lachnospiraceae bacterium]
MSNRQILARGIDVSTHQKKVDFNKVKAAGYTYVMIRVGYRGYKNGKLKEDKYFRVNIKNALAAGLDVGPYIFSTAISDQESVEDANFLISRVENYTITMPAVFDYEGYDDKKYRSYGTTKAQRTAFCKAFIDTVEAAGYSSMLYGSKGNIRTTYDIDKLNYPLWIAQYTGGYTKNIDDENYFPKMGTYIPRIALWQYTSIGKVPGISGNVDLDKMYIDVRAGADGKEEVKVKNPFDYPNKTVKYNILTQYIALESVKWLQWELVQAGYDLKIDGKFGKKTLVALKDYQSKHKLEADGKCGPLTKECMQAD